MRPIAPLMVDDHRHCDDLFARAEQAVSAHAWDQASAAYAAFKTAMLHHFSAEEDVLFPAFEAQSGMRNGPTQVMRVEHDQMRGLLAAAQESLNAHDADDYLGNTETLLIMMQQHNMKEEHVLYPMCDDHLQAQSDAVLQRIRQQLEAVDASAP